MGEGSRPREASDDHLPSVLGPQGVPDSEEYEEDEFEPNLVLVPLDPICDVALSKIAHQLSLNWFKDMVLAPATLRPGSVSLPKLSTPGQSTRSRVLFQDPLGQVFRELFPVQATMNRRKEAMS
jgi:hypothetical protein